MIRLFQQIKTDFWKTIAIGLNESSAQRTSMGTAVIGGTISSTLLTLVLLPIILLLAKNRVIKAAVSSGKRNRDIDQTLQQT